ncbi:hypothetical protein KIN20_010077, partial [Parelaphostrongylus tenuis]
MDMKSCIIVDNSTTNIIMANWSKAMWQDVMNTALRMLASGPLRSNFFSATAA